MCVAAEHRPRCSRCSGRSSCCRYRAADCLQMGAALGSQCLGACWRFLQRSIHAAARSSVSGGPRAQSGRLDVEVHALRGDGTNSNILQGSKAHVCEVTSLFHHALDTDDFGADGDHDRPFHRTYCRLIKIEGSCDGPLQHAIWLKQVQSIGVRMWCQDDQDAACAAGNHVRVPSLQK